MRGKRFNPLLCNHQGVFITRGCLLDHELYRQGEFALVKKGISRVMGELWVCDGDCIKEIDRIMQTKAGHFARENVEFTSFGHSDQTSFPVETYVWMEEHVPSGCLYVPSGQF